MAELLTDIGTIRARARQNIEQGPITEAYGADRHRVIEALDEAQGHADQVALRITPLGGDPDFDPEGLASRSHAQYDANEELLTPTCLRQIGSPTVPRRQVDLRREQPRAGPGFPTWLRARCGPGEVTMGVHEVAGGGMGRRRFLGWAGSRGVALGVAGVGVPALLAACGDDSAAPARGGGTTLPRVSEEQAAEEARPVVGDVVDFALTSDDWPGAFGFVTLRVHRGAFDGNDVYFVRTDASDQAYASAEGLVFVPKLATLVGDGLSGAAYVVTDASPDQPLVLSSEPGRDDYTPAWTLHRVRFSGEPRVLRSEAEVRDAETRGEATVERTNIVVNAGIVKWSSGEMAVDEERTGYLGGGQMLTPVDTTAMTATFKLGQCYPGSRYFVLDHSIPMIADMTSTSFSPRLQGGPSAAGATGRTNVFMNGLEGPGPMGFQPSAFDFDAGEAAWSPYWDHYTYGWKDGVTPRLLTSQTAIHEARDAGDIDEFPGTPDTGGEVFTVNCPVPVLAPATFAPG